MPPKNILLIDDEKTLIELFALALRQEGYKVYMAENGQQAMALLQEHPCQIIFSDINLPDRNGIELGRQIKELYPDTQLHAMTGDIYGLEDKLKQNSPFSSILSKPLHIATLLTVIKEDFTKLANQP